MDGMDGAGHDDVADEGPTDHGTALSSMPNGPDDLGPEDDPAFLEFLERCDPFPDRPSPEGTDLPGGGDVSTARSLFDAESGTITVDEALLDLRAPLVNAPSTTAVLTWLATTTREGTVSRTELAELSRATRDAAVWPSDVVRAPFLDIRTAEDGAVSWRSDAPTGKIHPVPDGVLGMTGGAWAVRAAMALYLRAAMGERIAGTEDEVARALHLRSASAVRHAKWRERLRSVVAQLPRRMGVFAVVRCDPDGDWTTRMEIDVVLPRLGPVRAASVVEPVPPDVGASMAPEALDVAGWTPREGGGADVGWIPVGDTPEPVGDPAVAARRYETAWWRGPWIARKGRGDAPTSGTVTLERWRRAVRVGAECDDVDIYWAFVCDTAVDPIRLSVDADALVDVAEYPYTSWYPPCGRVELDRIVETGPYMVAPRSFPGVDVLSRPGVVRRDRIAADGFRLRGVLEGGWMSVRRSVTSLSGGGTETSRWLGKVDVPASGPVRLDDLLRARYRPVVPVATALLEGVPVPLPLPTALRDVFTVPYRTVCGDGVPVVEVVGIDGSGNPVCGMIVVRRVRDVPGDRVHRGPTLPAVVGDLCRPDGEPVDRTFAAAFDTDWLSSVAADVDEGTVLLEPWNVPDALGRVRVATGGAVDPLSTLPTSYQATVDGVRRDVTLTLVRRGGDAMIELRTARATSAVVPTWLRGFDGTEAPAPGSFEEEMSMLVDGDAPGDGSFEDDGTVIGHAPDTDLPGLERALDEAGLRADMEAALEASWDDETGGEGAEGDHDGIDPPNDPVVEHMAAYAARLEDAAVSERVMAALARDTSFVEVAAREIGRMADVPPPTHFPPADLVSIWIVSRAAVETSPTEAHAVVIGVLGARDVAEGTVDRPVEGVPTHPVHRAAFVQGLLSGGHGWPALPAVAVDAACAFLALPGDPVGVEDVVRAALRRPSPVGRLRAFQKKLGARLAGR